jgi:hypothetical protein
MAPSTDTLPWERLFQEFEAFEIDEAFAGWPSEAFVTSLARPTPRFVEAFLARKSALAGRPDSVRALYAYLLEKRYVERINLLHFAFSIFDERTTLPGEVVDLTPYPHEDGRPPFRYAGDKEYLRTHCAGLLDSSQTPLNPGDAGDGEAS